MGRGWRRESARHSLAARGIKMPHKSARKSGARKSSIYQEQPPFNWKQDRIMVKGVSKRRWRCPECLRALSEDESHNFHCRLHGPVTESGKMMYYDDGRDRPLDVTTLPDSMQQTIIEIGR